MVDNQLNTETKTAEGLNKPTQARLERFMRDLASFADVNRHIQGSLTPYQEILSNISVINDCGRNLKAMHKRRC